jgi:hypothetical protein
MPADQPSESTAVDKKFIISWALTPDNNEKAIALGLRLITFAGQPDKANELDSLGEVEDRITEWAIANPFSAKIVILKLLPKLQAKK